MFLGVSGDLPTTSYVKMVEIWLLFSLMVPFISVLLHIYIDNLRVSSWKNCIQQSFFVLLSFQDDDDRTINHHGVERPVGGPESNTVQVKPAHGSLISRNEKVEFEARKQFYKSLVHGEKKMKKIERLVFIGKVVFPIFIISFSAVYFFYGLSKMT